MKKIMTIAAAALAGAAMADITSENIVGYNTTPTTTDTSILIGASFEDAGGKNTFLPLSSLVATPALESGDQIQVAYTDGDGLTQFTVYEYDATDGWLDTVEFNPVGDTFGLTLGQSAWFISAGEAKTITTAGSVKSTNTVRAFTETSALITSAYPTSFCPNSTGVSWNVSGGDQIQVAYTDGDGLTQFTVYEYDATDGWLDTVEFTPLAADTAVVGPGVGFWLILQDASSTFTETTPIAK